MTTPIKKEIDFDRARDVIRKIVHERYVAEYIMDARGISAESTELESVSAIQGLFAERLSEIRREQYIAAPKMWLVSIEYGTGEHVAERELILCKRALNKADDRPDDYNFISACAESKSDAFTLAESVREKLLQIKALTGNDDALVAKRKRGRPLKKC